MLYSLGDIQNLTDNSPGKPAIIDPGLSRNLE